MSEYVFGCPTCNREFRILPEVAGEVTECPHCFQSMRVPADQIVVEESSNENSGSEETTTAESGLVKATEPSIAHLLPPQFAVLDPGQFKRHANSENNVLLPTADGGVQSVSERLVTIEYKGQKYVLVAMSPEARRRRQIIVNIVSIFVAIGAIAGTMWILMK